MWYYRVACLVLAGSLAVANGANVIRADLYNLRFGTCVDIQPFDVDFQNHKWQNILNVH